jgi:tRNA (guanine-N7-)-methyltransferase
LLPDYGIAFPAKIESRKPLVLEIGSGMGETTAEIAKANPDAEFRRRRGHGPGVGSLLNRIHQRKDPESPYRAPRRGRSSERMVADGSLAAVHLLLPDPWPKKRHHKRRLVRPAFVALLARKLSAGGIVHAATDWPDYADQIAALFSENDAFVKSETGFAARPVTKFESRGRRLGHPVRDLVFRRRETAPAGR